MVAYAVTGTQRLQLVFPGLRDTLSNGHMPSLNRRFRIVLPQSCELLPALCDIFIDAATFG